MLFKAANYGWKLVELLKLQTITLNLSLFNVTTDIKPADRLKHDKQVASGDELHNQRAVSILHDHTQQLDHPLMVQAGHDVSLLQQWPFTLPGKYSKDSENQISTRQVA